MSTEDIVAHISKTVTLERVSEGRYRGLCPFHAERTPSFYVNAKRQFFFCFGCGARGDLGEFARRLERAC